MRLLLHRWADTDLRGANERLRRELRAQRRIVADLRNANSTLTTVASIRSARIGQLEHALAEMKEQNR